jgi:Leucine-rich repeat (LRR) protein
MFPALNLRLLLHLLLLATASYSHALASSNETDLDALLEFKAGLNRQSADAFASWNKTTDFCKWRGVICSLRHKQRVSALNLSSSGLLGYITPSIGNLTYLRSLDLSYNLLQGDIPQTIGQLMQMSYLDLSNNSLQGEMPRTIGQLPQLTYLYLSNNSLQGEIAHGLRNCTRLASVKLDLNKLDRRIPEWLGELSRIETISIGKNRFTGIIPQSLGNLSSLRRLYLNENQLSGPIPESLGKLRKLEGLALQVNHLSGNIPGTLFNISSLVHVGLQMNQLKGTLPSNLGPNIRRLILALNHFTGRIPASIANATTIQSMDLSGNKITGIVPPEIGTLCPKYLMLNQNHLKATNVQDWGFITLLTNCTSLRWLTLQNNKFSGGFPTSVANLSGQLEALDIRYNEISGKIPLGIGSFPKLFKLGLSGNHFTGPIPDSIGRLTRLQFLTLENNQLSGMIPSSLGNLTRLQHLSADNNILEGPLPISIGNLQQLVSATFSNNALSGRLPGEIFSLSSLSYVLDLSSNHFSSSLPSQVGGLTKLTYLYIHENNLSGMLPDALSNCQSLMELRLDGNYFNGMIPLSISRMQGLVLLNLTKNRLTGGIPQDLGLMNGLNELYLAHNSLSAKIPKTLESMTYLYRLDISFNLLDGQVPGHGVFTNLTGFTFYGNAKLCGGIQELHLPSCPAKTVGHGQRITRVIRNAVIPSITIISVCFIMAVCFFSLKNKLRLPSTSVAPSLTGDMYPRVSYSNLFQATNGFATDNLVGTGRYGCVYKGMMTLNKSVRTMAVKVFDLEQAGSSECFLAECKALGKIRHRNLIGVITCCSCSDFKQNDFKAIVLDFMPYGGLDKWLHPGIYASNPVKVLTLMQRLSIASDIAAGLDYLHNHCRPTIVHCDFKPSNILLGDDMVAHVGDFGLAKILADPEGEQLVNSTSSVVGTIGYVPPGNKILHYYRSIRSGSVAMYIIYS